jgi:hypothetical protein
MKIIHSFWSKPLYKKNNFNNWDRANGGWFSRRYNFYSWALSCLTFRKYYDHIELYTDSIGEDILVRQLELPYTKVHNILDQIEPYHHDLWAIGKIYTYKQQKEPFLHVDGDVFIWKKFDETLFRSNLIVQNLEGAFSYYQETYKEIKDNFLHIPICIQNNHESPQLLKGVNAGIFGGSDINFISHYATTAIDLITKNIKTLENINIGLFNNFYEQCLFRVLADQNNKTITPLFKNVNERFDNLCEFTGIPSNLHYIHTIGDYKKRQETHDMLAFRLELEFPEYYYRINNLLKVNQI